MTLQKIVEENPALFEVARGGHAGLTGEKAVAAAIGEWLVESIRVLRETECEACRLGSSVLSAFVESNHQVDSLAKEAVAIVDSTGL